jgi:hypothetical protein
MYAEMAEGVRFVFSPTCCRWEVRRRDGVRCVFIIIIDTK